MGDILWLKIIDKTNSINVHLLCYVTPKNSTVVGSQGFLWVSFEPEVVAKLG